MYPAGEQLTLLASEAFQNALQDVDMLVPTGMPNAGSQMFQTTKIDVRLGGDASITGSTQVIKVPLTKPYVIITVGEAYGTEMGYAGDTYKDCEIWVPFKVWTNTGETDKTVKQYLEFARDHRQNVFSKNGLDLKLSGLVGGRPVIPSPVPGLDVTEYRWRFFYSRS